MLKKICVEFSEDALAIINKQYADPVVFVEACINQGLSRISDYTDLFVVDSDLDISKAIPKSQSDRDQIIRQIIKNVQVEHDDGNAPKKMVIEEALKIGMETNLTEALIKRLKRDGSIFEPKTNLLRVT